jgi:hypothetical protein
MTERAIPDPKVFESKKRRPRKKLLVGREGN